MMQLLQIPAPLAQMEVTEALAAAVSEAAKMPVEDQNYIAFRIMEEIAEEKKWNDSFTHSPEALEDLATQARQDIAEGKTYPLAEIL
jgi:hypothetical protein